jgi:hypothetical protein
MGYGKTVCAEVFAKHTGKIETYMGPVFEECSVQFLWRSKYGFRSIGRWWGPNPKEKKEEEIDILAIDKNETTWFGECKWRNTRAGNDILEDLIRKSALFPGVSKKQFIIFSKSGFTTQLVKTTSLRKDTVLVNLTDMF